MSVLKPALGRNFVLAGIEETHEVGKQQDDNVVEDNGVVKKVLVVCHQERADTVPSLSLSFDVITFSFDGLGSVVDMMGSKTNALFLVKDDKEEETAGPTNLFGAKDDQGSDSDDD